MTPTPEEALIGILGALVDYPDRVSVVPVETGSVLVFEVTLHASDHLKMTPEVVGSIRDILKATGASVQKRVDLVLMPIGHEPYGSGVSRK
jgi:predicted RNA-binding protein YlqC (UPF0109 family)